ncbi:gamma-glutamylcyclotransferase [Halalkalibacillus halophilus]|uniref:gamma-glutamylcyclotransferase n=1 Tax=Halalkalibacillus halophilus TaxID=392827 RepID=UPI000427E4BE|nr:gamma-glutamylcyclotransferase [Halalkalibacillus halophilus]
METKYLFVYGTLQRHERNHHWLEGANMVAEQAWTNGKLIATGKDFPGLINDEETIVYGELYEVDEEILTRIDQLEGNIEGRSNFLYDRFVEDVRTDFGTFQAYVHSIEEPEHGYELLNTTDWKVDQRLKQGIPLYFAYGSCMDHERIELAGMLNEFHTVGLGILSGYDMDFTTRLIDGGRADITEKSDSHVQGVVYEINERSLSYLYQREGVDAGKYRPAYVDVEIDGTTFNVLTFIVINKEPSISPPDHYINEIVRGGQSHVSEEYLEDVLRKARK